MRKYKIKIPKNCSIPAIYKAIAVAAKKNPERFQYDCQYVWVASDIFEAFSAYMTSVNLKDSIGTHWMLYGPKVDEHLNPGEVIVEKGFFVD